MKLYRRFFIAICIPSLSVCFSAVWSQVFQCPANIDFEFGDFTNWECYTGSVAAVNSQNTISWSNVSNTPTPGRMGIIGPGDNTTDPYGGFPVHCPNSSGDTMQTKDAKKAFSTPGLRTATLAATSGINCADSISKSVTISAFCKPLVPSGFTPNADGKNDRLTPYLAGVKSLHKFAIYDRLGNTVFSTTTEGKGWDGTYNGIALAAGTFIWMLEYTDADNHFISAKGTVILIR